MLAPRFNCCRRKVLRISEKVEPKADNFVQTREIEKLNLGIDLRTETALSHRVRTQCTKKI
jgi:hypothetical protein